MKNKIFTILTLILVLFSSCDDYVDIEQQGILIPESLQDLRSILNENNTFENASHINDYYFTDDTFVPVEKIEAFTTSSLFNNATASRYNFDDEFYTLDQDDRDWNGNYEMIGRVNYVLDALETFPGNQTEKDQLRGESLIQRASAYLDLVNLYSRHYSAGDPNEAETGVPLVTVFGDAEVSLVRASIQEVYDQILLDLNEGVNLIQNTESQFKFKASKICGYALLARAYLHLGNYQLAADNASAALNINNSLLDYQTELEALGNTLGDPTELFDPDFANTKETILHRRGFVTFAFSIQFVPVFAVVITPFTYMTPDVLSLYDTTYDMRYTNLTSLDFTAGFARRWTGADKLRTYFMTDITIPEVILIRAESYARLDNVGSAMDDLNYLRANRFNTDDTSIINLNASSAEEALTHALEERRRELVFRGTRFYDIKRLNAVDNASISITRNNLDGVEVTVPANDNRWAMPIAPLETLLDPSISQNPR